MEIIDIKKTIKNKKIQRGTILILQGYDDKAINILHSGMAELLSCPGYTSDLSPDKIIEKSQRVGLIRGESIYGLLSLMSTNPYAKSVRALTECVISVIPTSNDNLFNNLKGNIELNIQVLRALIQRINSGDFLLSNYKSLLIGLSNLQTAIALSVKTNSSKAVKNSIILSDKNLEEYARGLKNRLNKNNIPEPEKWDPNLFLGNIQKELNLNNDIESVKLEELIDYKQFLFFKRFLRMPYNVLIPVFKKDEPWTFYIYQFLHRCLEPVIQKNEQISGQIHNIIQKLFAKNGWIARLIKEQESKNENISIYNYYLSKFCWRFRKEIIQLIGIDIKDRYTVYSDLQQYSQINLESILDKKNKGNNMDVSIEITDGIIDKYKNLMSRILEFAEMGEDFENKFIASYEIFKNYKNKFENIPQLNDLKNRIAEQYWLLYEKCFLKSINTNFKEFIPGIMLNFGVLDETLIDKNHIALIDQAFSRSLYSYSQFPVMTLPYFLEKIYKKEANPSITDMGHSFNDVLNKKTRNIKKRKLYEYQDTIEDHVKYEIKEIISLTSKMLFGSISTAFPILCSDAIFGSPEQIFISPDELARVINEYMERDFSMFYREVVFHHKYGSLIIKKKVIPNFVLYPVFGTKMLMWQELDGAKRNTPGRFFLPIFFNGDIKKSFLTLIGNFRWNLHKLIAGGSWMDPIEGGLVGNYYDYIAFFKKNPNLTGEVKNRLKEFVKKTRSDKDRFTYDYIMWVFYEFEGIPKLNNITRDIFYRFCPFKEKDRKRLENRPVFSNLEIKFQSIIKRSILKVESCIRKYEKTVKPVPEDLINYFKFLKY